MNPPLKKSTSKSSVKEAVDEDLDNLLKEFDDSLTTSSSPPSSTKSKGEQQEVSVTPLSREDSFALLAAEESVEESPCKHLLHL